MKHFILLLVVVGMCLGCSKKEDEEVEDVKTNDISLLFGVKDGYQFNYSYSIFSKGERKEYIYENVTHEKMIFLHNVPLDRDSISGFFNYTGSDSIYGMVWIYINNKKVVDRTLSGKSFSTVFELSIPPK